MAAEQLHRAIKDATVTVRTYGEPPVPSDLTFTEVQVLGPWLPA